MTNSCNGQKERHLRGALPYDFPRRVVVGRVREKKKKKKKRTSDRVFMLLAKTGLGVDHGTDAVRMRLEREV